jgi:hypothetical protein
MCQAPFRMVNKHTLQCSNLYTSHPIPYPFSLQKIEIHIVDVRDGGKNRGGDRECVCGRV